MRARIGSRGSNLAVWQARWVADALARLKLPSEIVIIKTTGDRRLERFSTIDARGMFIKEIEEALLRREIDLAVHSLKDLPVALPAKLLLAAIPERENPADVLIAGQPAGSIAALAAGARVGTSSPRRIAQLRALRPDLQIVEIRGNVETRIKSMDDGRTDAVVLAFAGVHRLGMDHRIGAMLDFKEMLPAPGQGALALETHEENRELNALLRSLDHMPTRTATEAERLLLEKMGGGCRLPLGALAQWQGDTLHLQAVIAKPDSGELLRAEAAGDSAEEAAEKVSTSFASRMSS